MFEVIILAIALSMDAFAVSLTLGTQNKTKISKVAILAGLYFGVFQGIMPLVGYLGGVAMFGWLGGFAHWIAFVLLVIIGLKMMYEALTSQTDESALSRTYSHYALLLLAIATSIDALAAGFTLTLMSVNGIYACVLIGIITFIFSYAGVHMGRRTSHWLGNKAEFFGGIVLVLLGFKILLL
jgi:putative Mn2+ efflux pump MntP